jgi:hypothetical protein
MNIIYASAESPCLTAHTLGDHSRPAGLENLHVGIGSLTRSMEPNKEEMGTMKTNTGMLSRLEFCYLDVAYYLFDRSNWRWRPFCLDTHSQ